MDNEATDRSEAAYAFVAKLMDEKRLDGTTSSAYPFWHGWALREALLASIVWKE